MYLLGSGVRGVLFESEDDGGFGRRVRSRVRIERWWARSRMTHDSAYERGSLKDISMF